MSDAGPQGDALVPGVAGGSLSVAAWTAVSRVTGFIRLAIVGAVLGPTYLANTFQAINQFPELVYAALTGTVFTMLLVPVPPRARRAAFELAQSSLLRALIS